MFLTDWSGECTYPSVPGDEDDSQEQPLLGLRAIGRGLRVHDRVSVDFQALMENEKFIIY